MHENQTHRESCFVTLTYSDEHLPPGGTLVVAHFQAFMKRLRKQAGRRIRFFHCGEYGENTWRPHYHALLFGLWPADATKLPGKSKSGSDQWRSESLEKIWGLGNVTIGTVNFESAAYVARYILKKVNGQQAESHYTRVDLDTGEIHKLQPEYTTMSRRPGIGAEWFQKFHSEVFPADEVIARGHPSKPPRFYDKLHKRMSPSDLDEIKALRMLNGSSKQNRWNSTSERLKVRETVAKAKTSLYKRDL